jgi:TP901 family phage tail tape measure protein
MANLTSQLVVELLDRVTSPARKVANSLAGISNTVREMGDGQRVAFGDRLDAAITRNNRALEAARGNLVDAAAGFYALKTAIAGPVQAAMAFEDAMADVTKVVDFGTPEAFSQFQKDLFALSRDVPVAVDGLAQIAAAAGAAGIAGDELVRFTEAAAKVGVAFEISADDAGVAMSKMMTGLGLTLDETVRLADAMNHLSDAQASNASEILDVVRRVGAQGKMFGFTAEQTAAFGSAMIAAGAQSDVAATSFNNMGKALTRGAAATKGQREAYAALGMDAEEVARKMQEDAVGTTVSVLEALSRIPKEQQAAVASQLFGDEARALGPLLTNLDLVRSSLGLVGDEAEYAGSAFREFENRNRTFSSALQRLRNRISELSIAIGSALLPALDKMVAFIGPLVTKIADLAAAYPEVTAAIVGATGAVVAFKVASAGLAYLGLVGRGGLLSAIALGYNTVGRAAIGAKAAASSMIALQTALAGMSGQSLGTLGKIGAGLRGIALAVPGVGLLGGALTAVGGAIAAISAPVWGAIVAGILAVAAVGGTIYRHWDRISATFSGLASRLGEEFAPALELARPLIDWLSGVGATIGASWDGARAALSGFWDWFSGFFAKDVLTEDQKAAAAQSGYDFADRMIEGIKGVPARIIATASEWFEAGKQLIQALWDGMVAIFDSLVAWVEQKIDKLLQPLRDAKAALAALNPFGGGGDGGGVDGERAKGGPISRGSTYLVGEEGPELITASRSGYVNPAGSGMGGGATLNLGGININAAPGMSPQDVAQAVRREIESASREFFRGVYADTGMRFT